MRPSLARRSLLPVHQAATASPAAPQDRLMRASLSPLGVMPHPADVDNPAWQALPAALGSKLLSRFDQTLCANHHQPDPKAMCAGLSLQWLEAMRSVHADPGHSAARLASLATFEDATHARVTQNLYMADHRHRLQEARQQDDAASAIHAGIAGLVEAAGMKDLSLSPLLGSDELPFSVVADRHGRVDREMLAKATEALAGADRGILVIYTDRGSHAIGFTESTPGKKILFDPNLGEFAARNADLPELIEALSAASDMDLIGINVLELR
jgi:YopT-type cysteine protease-like protein